MTPVPHFTPLRRIPTPKGEVRHGLKASDASFAGFGEAYFTEVLWGETKGWKRHRLMTMNLVVVCGTVRFVLRNDVGNNWQYVLSTKPSEGDYGRLTVPPGLWMAFQGVGRNCNLIMNFASHEHDPGEADSRGLEDFPDAIPNPTRAPPDGRA